MYIFILIIISFAVVWLDIALISWLPNFLVPIWAWIGIHYFVLKEKSSLMWFWIFSLAVMNSFIGSISDTIFFFLIFSLGGQIFYVIYRKYLSTGNILLILLPGTIILSLSLLLYLLITGQIIDFNALGKICSTILISGIITFFYDPQKEKKKYI